MKNKLGSEGTTFICHEVETGIPTVVTKSRGQEERAFSSFGTGGGPVRRGPIEAVAEPHVEPYSVQMVQGGNTEVDLKFDWGAEECTVSKSQQLEPGKSEVVYITQSMMTLIQISTL
ncbi:unnamed protein product [Protopolystoma xenopodis]|uniref:Uncharacterized protein n=1 Tax=Protopolystoma xenopodis TaxID=117903 RepID=A0A448WYK1_9PLAT|nr:unnamed protein product [Protopolystoma xenopodis]